MARPSRESDQHYAHLIVLDVPVTLRALTPVGAAEVIRRMATGLPEYRNASSHWHR
ncbi:hypothetical protein AB0873_32460 [Micromonospora sp. NPDC047707]|uniref:hypothetical protein n=1 Tax=Micromonospora sp. NPDC047707 TaxID=3154498 RepID=UPI00345676E3